MTRRNAYDATPSEDIRFLTKYVMARATLPVHVRQAAMEVHESFLQSGRLPNHAFATLVIDMLLRWNEGQRIAWRAGVAAENLARWSIGLADREGLGGLEQALAGLHPENSLSGKINSGNRSPPD